MKKVESFRAPDHSKEKPVQERRGGYYHTDSVDEDDDFEPAIETEPPGIESIETAKGSIYRFLPDGTTQRFKSVEGRAYEPQQAMVFVPDYHTLKKASPEGMNFESIFGESPAQYSQILLDIIQAHGSKAYILDASGRVLETNAEIASAEGQVTLYLEKPNEKPMMFPVAKKPKVGFMTFDTRKYQNESGETMRERHLGNPVVKINHKQR